jgi:hypothetical protein
MYFSGTSNCVSFLGMCSKIRHFAKKAVVDKASLESDFSLYPPAWPPPGTNAVVFSHYLQARRNDEHCQ